MVGLAIFQKYLDFPETEDISALHRPQEWTIVVGDNPNPPLTDGETAHVIIPLWVCLYMWNICRCINAKLIADCTSYGKEARELIERWPNCTACTGSHYSSMKLDVTGRGGHTPRVTPPTREDSPGMARSMQEDRLSRMPIRATQLTLRITFGNN